MTRSMKPKADTKLDPQTPASGASAPLQRLKRLLTQLEAHPALLDQIERVLGLASGGDPTKPLASVDAVEGELVEGLRKLGNQTLREWAQAAQAQALEATKAQRPTARVKKKAR
jgi:hypothetical protein